MVNVTIDIPEEKYIMAKMLCKVIGYDSIQDLCMEGVNMLCRSFEEAVEDRNKGV